MNIFLNFILIWLQTLNIFEKNWFIDNKERYRSLQTLIYRQVLRAGGVSVTKHPDWCKVRAFCMPCERSKGAATLSVLPLMNIPRWRFVEAFEKHNFYSFALFHKHLIRSFPCPVACVQTEIGQKFKSGSVSVVVLTSLLFYRFVRRNMA